SSTASDQLTPIQTGARVKSPSRFWHKAERPIAASFHEREATLGTPRVLRTAARSLGNRSGIFDECGGRKRPNSSLVIPGNQVIFRRLATRSARRTGLPPTTLD